MTGVKDHSDVMQTARTDLAGQHPLYFSGTEQGVLFDSSPASFGKEANLPYIAAWLVGMPDLLFPNQSAYEGVGKISCGERAVIESKGRVHIEPELLVPNHSWTVQDAAEQLRQVLPELIRADVSDAGQEMSADFSGGLDSTSIALLALQYTDRLHGFIQYRPGLAAGDLRFARTAAKNAGPRLVLHELAGTEATLPYSNLFEAPHFADGPSTVTTIDAAIRQRFAAAKAIGSTLHFTGEGGDALLDVAPNHLIDLARLSDQRTLYRVIADYSFLRRQDPQELLAHAVKNKDVTFQQELRRLAWHLECGTEGRPLTWLAWPGTELQWLTPRTRQMLADNAEAQSKKAVLPPEIGVADFVARSTLADSASIHRYFAHTAASYGIALKAPLLHDEVVRTCLGVPAYRRADPYKFKQILRTAFAGVLPQTLLERTSKGSYSNELYRGIRTNIDSIKQLLADSALADHGIIDPKKVIEDTKRLSIGEKGPLGGLGKVISAEVWLRRATSGGNK